MINFELLRDPPKPRGLRMELSLAASSSESSVWVGEAAFGLLEPSVKEHCVGYKEFSHWGVTEIRREEWSEIRKDWQGLAAALERATAASDYTGRACRWSSEASREFAENFSAVRSGLLQLISELSAWIEDAMESHQSVFLRGV